MESCILILVLGVFTRILGILGGDFGCQLDETTERIQVAIVADMTGTNYKNIQSVFATQCAKIMQEINKLRKGSEFALTVFSNWQQDAFKPGLNESWGPHNQPEGCYKRIGNFTTDEKKMTLLANSTLGLNGPSTGSDEENSISAIAFTMADLSIGWAPVGVNTNEMYVHKIVILFTDAFSIFSLPIPGNRKPFKGDGTDTCTKSLPPTRKKAADIMEKHGISVIGVYVNMKDKAYNLYNQYFDTYGINHFPKRFANTGELNDTLVPFITEQVKKDLECIFEDPIGYNSLGL